MRLELIARDYAYRLATETYAYTVPYFTVYTRTDRALPRITDCRYDCDYIVHLHLFSSCTCLRYCSDSESFCSAVYRPTLFLFTRPIRPIGRIWHLFSARILPLGYTRELIAPGNILRPSLETVLATV